MRVMLSVLLVFWIPLLPGCEPALQVTSDYDNRVQFGGYRTFELYGKAAQNISSLNQDRILRCVRSRMLAKGFVEDSIKADILVNITAIVTNGSDVTANTNYYGYGGAMRPYYWNAGMSSSSTTFDVEHYKQGSLVIDIVDNATQKLIWQGVGNSRIDESVKEPDSRICGAVEKIMENFPPKGQKK